MERSHGKPEVAEWADPILRGAIRVETDFVVDAVDPDAETITSTEGTELDYDLLVAIPPHTGSDFVESAGLGDGGWVDVDKRTLEATGFDDVYAIGDAALPGPKAGSAAHFQAFASRSASPRRSGAQPRSATTARPSASSRPASTRRRSSSSTTNARRPSAPSRAMHWAKHAYNESYWLTARGLL